MLDFILILFISRKYVKHVKVMDMFASLWVIIVWILKMSPNLH